MSEFGVFAVGVTKDKRLNEAQRRQVNEQNAQRKIDINQRAEDYYNMTAEEQEEIRLGGTYVIPRNETPELVGKSVHQHNKNLGLVRNAITANLHRDVYQDYDTVVASEDQKVRELDFHHSTGAQANRLGYDTLSIDVGGSGFEQLRKEHSGLKGQGDDLSKPGAKERFRRIYGEKIGRFTSIFSKVFGAVFRSKKGIFERSRTDTETGATAKKFTISGPPALNIGSFDMQHINGYIGKIEKEYLDNIYNDWMYRKKLTPMVDLDPIPIKLRGHSRGAAAIAVASKNFKKWAEKAYGSYFTDHIKLEFVQRDPVPGWGSGSGEYGSVDLREYGSGLNATTIYSIHSEHGDSYKPQLVRGQSRIILTAEKHGVGQDEVENTQREVNAADKYHERAYVDAGSANTASLKGKTLQAFRGSGIGDMEEGVYMRDENNVLVRMRSYAEAKRVINMVKTNASGQEERAEVVDKAIKNWFIDHEYVDSSYTIEELEYDHTQSYAHFVRMDYEEDNLPDTAEFGPTMSAIRQVYGIQKNNMVSDESARAGLLGAYDSAIEAIKKYMDHDYSSKDLGEQNSLGFRMEMFSEILSTLRAEKLRIQNLEADEINTAANLTFDKFLTGAEKELRG